MNAGLDEDRCKDYKDAHIRFPGPWVSFAFIRAQSFANERSRMATPCPSRRGARMQARVLAWSAELGVFALVFSAVSTHDGGYQGDCIRTGNVIPIHAKSARSARPKYPEPNINAVAAMCGRGPRQRYRYLVPAIPTEFSWKTVALAGHADRSPPAC
jgi:hypothetical protein